MKCSHAWKVREFRDFRGFVNVSCTGIGLKATNNSKIYTKFTCTWTAYGPNLRNFHVANISCFTVSLGEPDPNQLVIVLEGMKKAIYRCIIHKVSLQNFKIPWHVMEIAIVAALNWRYITYLVIWMQVGIQQVWTVCWQNPVAKRPQSKVSKLHKQEAIINMCISSCSCLEYNFTPSLKQSSCILQHGLGHQYSKFIQRLCLEWF